MVLRLGPEEAHSLTGEAQPCRHNDLSQLALADDHSVNLLCRKLG